MKQDKTEILVSLDPHGFGQIQSFPASHLGSHGGCCVQLFVAPWPAALQAPLSTLSQSLLELFSIKLVMPSHHLIFCHPLLLLPSVFPSIGERRSNWSILKEINPEYLLEGLVLKLKLQYFGLLIQRADSLEKTPMLGILAVSRKGQLPTLGRLAFLSTGR